MAKKKPKKPVGRPPQPLLHIDTSPEALAKELLKQRPLREVEKEQKQESG